MKVQIRKHKSGWWGIFKECSKYPFVLKDTELECYQYCQAQNFIII